MSMHPLGAGSATMLLLLPLLLSTAAAQDATAARDPLPFEVPPALEWLVRGPREAGVAIVLGALLGGLIAAFSFVGGELPGTFGAADLKRKRSELQVEREEIEALLDKDGDDADARVRLQDIRDREKDLEKEARAQRWSAGTLYVAGGVVAALLLARTIFEAVGIGLAGPAAVGLFLKSRTDAAVAGVAARLASEAGKEDDAGGPASSGAPAAAGAPPPAAGAKARARKLRVARAMIKR